MICLGSAENTQIKSFGYGYGYDYVIPVHHHHHNNKVIVVNDTSKGNDTTFVTNLGSKKITSFFTSSPSIVNETENKSDTKIEEYTSILISIISIGIIAFSITLFLIIIYIKNNLKGGVN